VLTETGEPYYYIPPTVAVDADVSEESAEPKQKTDNKDSKDDDESA